MGKPILTCAVVSDVTFGYVILIKCFWDLIILNVVYIRGVLHLLKAAHFTIWVEKL
ncbi:hypothetical protein YC2023_068216 [Brassica napus]